MERQITQCLACSRVKNPDGSWLYKEISPFQKKISHSYCVDCVRTLQEKLLAARDFKKWDLEKQVDYLRKEMDTHSQSHDKESFKHYMEEFFCISEQEYEDKYYERLKDKLVDSVCGKCRDKINPDEGASRLGTHLLHRHCYKELAHKINIVKQNKWEESNKLDAYFDLLRIEKKLRPAVKDLLKKPDRDTKEELV